MGASEYREKIVLGREIDERNRDCGDMAAVKKACNHHMMGQYAVCSTIYSQREPLRG